MGLAVMNLPTTSLRWHLLKVRVGLNSVYKRGCEYVHSPRKCGNPDNVRLVPEAAGPGLRGSFGTQAASLLGAATCTVLQSVLTFAASPVLLTSCARLRGPGGL